MLHKITITCFIIYLLFKKVLNNLRQVRWAYITPKIILLSFLLENRGPF